MRIPLTEPNGFVKKKMGNGKIVGEMNLFGKEYALTSILSFANSPAELI